MATRSHCPRWVWSRELWTDRKDRTFCKRALLMSTSPKAGCISNCPFTNAQTKLASWKFHVMYKDESMHRLHSTGQWPMAIQELVPLFASFQPSISLYMDCCGRQRPPIPTQMTAQAQKYIFPDEQACTVCSFFIVNNWQSSAPMREVLSPHFGKFLVGNICLND